MNGPVLYLSSLESVRLAPVRECLVLRHLRFDTGKPCSLVRLMLGICGQEFGVASDIDLVVLSNRHEGETLSPIHEFPCFVFVARPLITDIQIREEITRNELEIVGWGELYRTRADAVNHVFAS